MSLSNRIAKLSGRKEQIEKTLSSRYITIKHTRKRQKSIEEAQVLLQISAQETQGAFKVHLEDIVQTALNTCFPNKYKFCIEFIPKSGSTVCDIYLKNKYGCRVDPKDSTGGGVVDVISIALRMAVWTLTRPDNVLILDEPFKWLSKDLRPLGGEILSMLSKKLGMQIICVTHDVQMMGDIADKIFNLSLNKKLVSRVRVVKEPDDE